MSLDEGLLITCVLILLFVILYYIGYMTPSPQINAPVSYCFNSTYGCCPLSELPRVDAMGTNC